MPAGDVYRILTFGTSLSQQVMNTLAVQVIGAAEPVSGDYGLLASDWKTALQPWQHSSTLWTTWQARQLWGAGMSIDAPKCRRLGGKVFAGLISAPLQGAMGLNQPLPPQCSAVVTQVTGTIGRRKRGRIYVFGLGEQDQSGGLWDSAFVTNITGSLTTFFNKYKSGGTSPNFMLGVWSERTASGCVPNPNGKGHIQVDTPNPDVAFTPITSYSFRPTVFTQRRRTLGVGR